MSININGRAYEGNNITINGDKIIIDGNTVINDSEKIIFIQGDVENLTVNQGDVDIDGIAGVVNTKSGDVTVVGNVNTHITTQSGDVKVRGKVYGQVKSMSGDIKYQKP